MESVVSTTFHLRRAKDEHTLPLEDEYTNVPAYCTGFYTDVPGQFQFGMSNGGAFDTLSVDGYLSIGECRRNSEKFDQICAATRENGVTDSGDFVNISRISNPYLYFPNGDLVPGKYYNITYNHV